MDEDDDYQKFVSGLNAPEAVNRVHELTTKALCPFCENTEWLVEGDGAGVLNIPAPTFVMKDSRSFYGPAPAIPTIAISCSNCGFVRLHNISVVNKRG